MWERVLICRWENMEMIFLMSQHWDGGGGGGGARGEKSTSWQTTDESPFIIICSSTQIDERVENIFRFVTFRPCPIKDPPLTQKKREKVSEIYSEIKSLSNAQCGYP